MKQAGFGMTNVGRVRDHNEDKHLIVQDLGLYIVSDGLGGHAAGEVASEMVCATLGTFIKDNKHVIVDYAKTPTNEKRQKVLRLVREAIDQASNTINMEAELDVQKRGMGATLAMVLVAGNNAIVAHVGDSRVMMFRDDKCHQLTEDHSSLSEQLRKGVITADEAIRTRIKSRITRCIAHNISSDPDLLHVELAPGDRFLLCTDGLTDYTNTTELPTLCKVLKPSQWPTMLVDLANQRGGKDNITAVVVSIEADQETGPSVNPSSKLEALRRIPLFHELSYRDLLKIMGACDMRRYMANEAVVKDGDLTGGLYVIVAGKVQVSKAGRPLADLGPGDFFGEMSLLDNEPRSADVNALQPTWLLSIARDDCRLMLRDNPVLGSKMLWAFCQILNTRLRAANKQIALSHSSQASSHNTGIMPAIRPSDPVPLDPNDEIKLAAE